MGDTEYGRGSHARDAVTRLTENSLGVYEGTVISTASGFGGDEPGTLARVHVTRTIRATSSIHPENDLLVFHSYARFAAGGLAFCVGQRPLSAGDRVLVFVDYPALDAAQHLVFASNGLFIEHSGHVLAPASYLTDRSAPRDITLDRVRELAERSHEK